MPKSAETESGLTPRPPRAQHLYLGNGSPTQVSGSRLSVGEDPEELL